MFSRARLRWLLAFAAAAVGAAVCFVGWRVLYPPTETVFVVVRLDHTKSVTETREETAAQTAERHRRETAAKAKLQEEYERLIESKPAGIADMPAVLGPGDWPTFRGPNRDGVATHVRLDPDWAKSPPKLLWRQRIGPGWSSFATTGEFAVTAEQRGSDEAVVCYRCADGTRVWEHRYPAAFMEGWTEVGPRATPTISAGCVISLGGAGDLVCLDGRTGAKRWGTNILRDTDATTRNYGVAGSPLVVDGMVIVSAGGPKGSVVAYDFATGAKRWASGTARAAYASPTVAELAGVRQILDFNANGIAAYRLADGLRLWSHPWVTNPPEMNNVCQPIVPPFLQSKDVGVVFISSGYGVGGALLEVHPSADRWRVVEKRKSKSLRSKFASAALIGEDVVGLDDGILARIDLKTGERRWKGGRTGQFLLAGDLLLVLKENGDLAIGEPALDGWRELGSVAALDSQSWSFPAFAGRRVLVRNNQFAACFELAVLGGGDYASVIPVVAV